LKNKSHRSSNLPLLKFTGVKADIKILNSYNNKQVNIPNQLFNREINSNSLNININRIINDNSLEDQLICKTFEGYYWECVPDLLLESSRKDSVTITSESETVDLDIKKE